jgi:hypothetical protein
MTGANELPSWEPRELGGLQATFVAIVLVAAIIAFCVWVSTAFGPKPVPEAVMQVTLAQLTPPPPPKQWPACYFAANSA